MYIVRVQLQLLIFSEISLNLVFIDSMEEEIDIMDDVQHVVSKLETVLPRTKHEKIIDRDEIFLILLGTSAENGGDDSTDEVTMYHPIYRVNKAINQIMRKYARVQEYDVDNNVIDVENVDETDCDEENQNSSFEFESAADFEKNRALLHSFVHNYPDVDPKELQTKCESLGYNMELVQGWLDRNLSSLPEKKQVQAVTRMTLQDKLEQGKVLWSCPGCGAWYSVGKNTAVVKCVELGCGGGWCVSCGRRDHTPLPCRGVCDRLTRAEREVDIFARIQTQPDEVEGPVRKFKMCPRNDLDFTDPLQILYLAAEATFLRMVDKSGQGSTIGRKTIKSIEYVENESIRASFMEKKSKFLADKIPHNERLVFHGTNEENIGSILRQNFRLDLCHRFLHGKGVYFSEFPDISLGYGSGLLLCRVMLGRTYTGSGMPEEWDSKLVSPDHQGKGQMVVVPNTKQILPAFIITLA